MIILLILLPVALGVFCACQKDNFGRKQVSVMMAVQAVVAVLAAVVFIRGCGFSCTMEVTSTLQFSLRCDPFGSFFALLVSLCWLLSIHYASVYMKHEHREPRFFLFVFLTEGAMLGAAFAGDMMTLYLFYELTTVCSAPLVLHSLSRKALLGAGKYLYYSVAGAFVALFGMATLCQQGVSLSFIKGGNVTNVTALTLAAAFCIILGFSTKAGLYPMHSWLPTAHPAAPAPASALLSGIITKVGVVGVIRCIYFLVGPDMLRGTWVQTALIVLALVTVFMGSFMGCTEKVLKKRLAYSSVSNLSYVLLGVFVMTPVALVGALLQWLFHAFGKIGLFQCAGSTILLTDTETMDGFPGLGRKLPVTMVCFAMFSLSLVGIPPFGGFYSKWYLATGGLAATEGTLGILIPAVLLISALLTAVYLFWPVTHAFFPGKDFPKAERVQEPRKLTVSLIVLACLCLVLGMFHGGTVSVMERIVASIL